MNIGKKFITINLIFITLVSIAIPLSVKPILEVSASVAPIPASYATGLAFVKNNEIAVVKEALDVVIDGNSANINALYTVKNLTNEVATTESMFALPNIEGQEILLKVDDALKDYETKPYEQPTQDTLEFTWEQSLLKEVIIDSRVDTNLIGFELDFEPNEQYDINVSYKYLLGGRPSDVGNGQYGEISYYLSPSAVQETFQSLTISLTLDENLPLIKKVDFKLNEVSDFVYELKNNALTNKVVVIQMEDHYDPSVYNAVGFVSLIVGFLLIAGPYIAIAIVIVFISVPIIITLKRKRRKDGDILED